MTDRIDKYLDGALDGIALTPEERAQAAALERAVEETRAFVDSRPAPDLTTVVMSKVRQLGPPLARRDPSSLARLAEYIWMPREISFQWRPAYGLFVAAIALAVLLLPAGGSSPVNAPQVAQAPAAPRLFVQFRFQATDASTVRLAGSFTNWQPEYELHQTSPGIWSITLPLPLGVHDYAFVVDGMRWVSDPYAQAVDDGFGGTNSRIALLPPEDPLS